MSRFDRGLLVLERRQNAAIRSIVNQRLTTDQKINQPQNPAERHDAQSTQDNPAQDQKIDQTDGAPR